MLYLDGHDTLQRLFAVETLSGSSRQSPSVPAMTVVVPSADFAEHLPAGSRHQMIVPVPGSTQAEIVLDAVDSGVVAERLRAVGVDFGVAGEHGSLARMSLPALRRCLSVRPELRRPAWAAGPDRSNSAAERAAQQLEPEPRGRPPNRGAVRGMLP